MYNDVSADSYIVLSFVVCYICCCSFGSLGFIIAALLNYYMLFVFLDSADSKHLIRLDFTYLCVNDWLAKMMAE